MWSRFAAVLKHPLSIHQGTWSTNYKALLDLKVDIAKMLKDKKSAEQFVDWTTGVHVHMIFKSRNLINTLKNNGSVIINVKQTYPSKANVSIEEGLAQDNANTRVTSVFVYMEFDGPKTMNDTNPVSYTHLTLPTKRIV